jgi:hypothetical protein
MSMIGELTFFLGIQVKQIKQGTFVHQAKYRRDLMKKFKMAELKAVSTPMSTTTSLGSDEDGESIDQREYRRMIGCLLYLMATRPNIQFIVCLCACFQVSPRSSHLDDFDTDFTWDVWNVHIGMAIVGFLPYNTSAVSYSCWPIFAIPYNLQPSLCMKYEYMFLCLIISSPDHPGTCLNVMWKSLIEELK